MTRGFYPRRDFLQKLNLAVVCKLVDRRERPLRLRDVRQCVDLLLNIDQRHAEHPSLLRERTGFVWLQPRINALCEGEEPFDRHYRGDDGEGGPSSSNGTIWLLQLLLTALCALQFQMQSKMHKEVGMAHL